MTIDDETLRKRIREEMIELWADIFGAELRASLEKRDPVIWLDVAQAAARARVSRRTIYTEVRTGRLKAARIGGRRELRFRIEWIDAWLESAAPILPPKK